MPSLRSPLRQLIARLLIAALVVASLPAELLAARQLPPRLLTSLPAPGVAFARVDPLRGPIHADGLGSIRRLTDEQANITDGYTYSAFGELLSHTGSDLQPYAFSGEPLDLNSGWQYHRARWMDPSVGRFASVDPWSADTDDPATLHRYLYVGDDPVSRVDPTGLFPFSLMAAFLGQKVHRALGQDFTIRTGGLANDFPVFSILQIDPETCWPFPAACRTKPDLVHPVSAEVYEIKPSHSFAVGFLEVVEYIGVLDINDPLHRNWTAGVSYRPPPYLFINWLGGWDVAVSGPVNGVITYDAVSRAAVVGASLASLVVLASNVSRAGFAQLGMQIGLRPSFAF
jgi:RHS repeat-associated protein